MKGKHRRVLSFKILNDNQYCSKAFQSKPFFTSIQCQAVSAVMDRSSSLDHRQTLVYRNMAMDKFRPRMDLRKVVNSYHIELCSVYRNY